VNKTGKTAITLLSLSLSASAAGIITGAVIAYKKEKGFWGYVGFMLLGSIVGGLVVAVPGYIIMGAKLAKSNS
jgi:hypothetical protein